MDDTTLITEPALVDLDTACQLLANISRDTLKREMRAGRINAQRIGAKIVFRPEELRRYAEARPSWEPRS